MVSPNLIMTALHCSNEGLRWIQKDALKEPLLDDEVLIKILRAGICRTDLEILKGYGDVEGIIGHEFVGVVAATGEQEEAQKWMSKRVCADINIRCKKCSICMNMNSFQFNFQSRNHCPYRKCIGIRNADGCFATYIRMPICNLHSVPDCVSDALATFAEPLAAALRPLEQRLIPPLASTAIVGDGRLGLLVADVMVLRLRLLGVPGLLIPNKIHLFGHHAERNFIKPIETTFNESGNWRQVEDSNNIKPPSYWTTQLGYRFSDTRENLDYSFFDCFDVVIEASGSTTGLLFAAQVVKPQGKLVLKTTISSKNSNCPGNSKIFELIVVKEIEVVGSRCGSIQDALNIMSGHCAPNYVKSEIIVDGHSVSEINEAKVLSESIRLEKYISHVFPFSDAIVALEEASKKGRLHVQMTM